MNNETGPSPHITSWSMNQGQDACTQAEEKFFYNILKPLFHENSRIGLGELNETAHNYGLSIIETTHRRAQTPPLPHIKEDNATEYWVVRNINPLTGEIYIMQDIYPNGQLPENHLGWVYLAREG